MGSKRRIPATHSERPALTQADRARREDDVEKVIDVLGICVELLRAHRRVPDWLAVTVFFLLHGAQRRCREAIGLGPAIERERVAPLEIAPCGDPIPDVIASLRAAWLHLRIRWHHQERARYHALLRASWLIEESRATMGRHVSPLSATPVGDLLAKVGL